MDVLYRLSYIGIELIDSRGLPIELGRENTNIIWISYPPVWIFNFLYFERKTGLEPATLSLEG